MQVWMIEEKVFADVIEQHAFYVKVAYVCSGHEYETVVSWDEIVTAEDLGCYSD